MSTGTRNRVVERDVPALFAAYVAGESLAKIGEREGVSGERIRQIFRMAGYSPLPRAYVSRLRSEQRQATLRQPLIDAFKELRSVSAAARSIGCSVPLATKILLEAGEEIGLSHAWLTARSKPNVSAEFCRLALIEAARRNGGSISQKQYQAMIREGGMTGGRSWPWSSTVLLRLGVKTWNEALLLAGIPLRSNGAGSRGVSDEELIDLAAELERKLDRRPTPKEFTDLARTRGLPGIQSVKRRFGSWKCFVDSLNAMASHF